MPFLRNLLRDLVDKRLWPVAVVLLVALIAVPVVVSKTGDDAHDLGPTVAPLAGTEGGAVVRLAQATEERRRSGGTDDPFYAPPKPKAATGGLLGGAPSASEAANALGAGGGDVEVGTFGGDTDAGAAAGGSGGAAGLPSGPADAPSETGGGSPATGGGSPATTEAKPRPTTPAYGVTLRFGETGSLKTLSNVLRLAPLPSAANPFMVFLGISPDGGKAVFLVASDATVAGDGTCKPSASDCQTIEMEVGDTEFFDIDMGTGEVKQFQLDLVEVEKADGSSPRTSSIPRRESKAGRKILRAAIASDRVDISDLDYSPARGTLVPAVPESDDAETGDDERAARRSDLVGGHEVAVRTGPEPRPRVEADLKRLSPLPSADTTFLVFLGVLADGRTAVFANPFETPSEGAGACKPSPEQCRVVELEAGQRRVFDLDPGEGRIDYPVGIDSVKRRSVGSAIEAAAARGRESKAGRDFLRDGLGAGVLDLDGLQYDRAKGVLVRTEAAKAEVKTARPDEVLPPPAQPIG